MNSVKNTIKQYNMFKKGEKIAVACSGGSDSMCLLHFLFANKKEFGIDICVINVDHGIRENSADDSKFVQEYCNKNGIVCYKFKVDVPSLAQENKTGIEETARTARYKIFETMILKGVVDKVALAHHQQDQIETVLLNIFRGTGLKGAGGMNTVQGQFVRPFLNTSKTEIKCYLQENHVDYVDDQTNFDENYSRNFLRLNILPQLRKNWKNVDSNILNFSKICRQDDEYICSTINFDDIETEKNLVKIPLSFFALSTPVQNRVLKYAFEKLNLTKDVEKRHLDILRNLVKTGKNGSKISLPNKLKASLEYDTLTISVSRQNIYQEKDFKLGKTNFEDYAVIEIKRTENFDIHSINCHVLDEKKLPKNAKWRYRQDGDVFAKFGSGEKKLKDYFIDKKVPNRIREQIPVLANENEIFCVLGFEISEKVKVDKNTKKAYVINYKKISAK